MATQEQTLHYFERLQLEQGLVHLGRTNLVTQQIGFGSYRILLGNQDHEEALKKALLSGCNLIDTSANYGDGLSEKLIGKVLSDLVNEKLLSLNEVILVTKAGYIQGENLVRAIQREKEGKPFRDTVKVSENCYHSISPDFLEDQLTRSLERLNVSKIDFFLLHNPEYFLKATKNQDLFYTKIKESFLFLEEAVQKGLIGFYGVSSNTFIEDESETSFCSAERLLQVAESVSTDHHFALIQFPLNLYESGAVFEKNNGSKNLIDFARENKIATLVNRPFNSFHQNKMNRLTDVPYHPPAEESSFLDKPFIVALEEEAKFVKEYGSKLNLLRFAEVLEHSFTDLHDFATWKEVRDYQILPFLYQFEEQVERFLDVPMKESFAIYLGALEKLIEKITFYFENKAYHQSQALQEILTDHEPTLEKTSRFTQKLLQVYRSLNGVDVVLVGMRNLRYVEEILTLKPKISDLKSKEILAYFTH